MQCELRWRFLRVCVAAALAVVMSTHQAAVAATFSYYASTWTREIVGIQADGTVTSFGNPGVPADETINDFTYDPATGNFLMMTQYVVGGGPYPSYLWNLTIDPVAETSSSTRIGKITDTTLIEGGLAFNSSLTGSNQLYAIGAAIGSASASLQNVNTSTGAGSQVYTVPGSGLDTQALWTAPDGSLWTLTNNNSSATSILVQLGSTSYVRTVNANTGANNAGGVSVVGDTTYTLLSLGADSRLGTLEWDSVNNVYTGNYTQLMTVNGTDYTGVYAVPEPSTIGLAAIGIVGGLFELRRRRKQHVGGRHDTSHRGGRG